MAESSDNFLEVGVEFQKFFRTLSTARQAHVVQVLARMLHERIVQEDGQIEADSLGAPVDGF